VTEHQWSSVESFFGELNELPASERPARLAAIADAEVRREVASLLEHAGDGDTVSMVIGSLAAQLKEEGGPELRRIGPYRVVRRLGQGGQGAVFEAVRDDGSFQQRVAIKIVKWEIDSDTARQQFRRERQILAGLEHPHIARLLDGGETADGTPYLVMEFVDGRPLTAAAGNWPLHRKLELFLQVADAVSFAHRNLIVHRDLKPGNILVTKDGAPKLLDFGIAKLLDADRQRTLTTVQALTPHYASPEQVRGERISTASDVYSLGVVLYELLTGRLPYQIRSVTPSEIERAVCETSPAPAGISEDLDNILQMVLRKEPERRYAGVAELAEDIQRSMSSRPVSARPDTLLYRARKFARRNRFPILAAAMVAAALIGGVVASQREARRAERRFQQVRQLANSLLLDSDTSRASNQGAIAEREQIVTSALRSLEGLASEAGGDVALQADLVIAYEKVGNIQRQALGRIDDSRKSYARAIELGRRLLANGGATPVVRRSLANTYLGMLDIYARHGDRIQAIEWGQKAISLAKESDAKWRAEFLVGAYTQTAEQEVAVGRISQALSEYRSALPLAEGRTSRTPSDEETYQLASLLRAMATALKDRGDLEAATETEKRACDLFLSLHDPADPRYAYNTVRALLGPAVGAGPGPLDLLPRLTTPELVKRAVEIATQARSRDPRNTNLSGILLVAYDVSGLKMAGDPEAAARFFQRALGLGEELTAADPKNSYYAGNCARAEVFWGNVLREQGRTAEALVHLRRAEGFQKLVDVDRALGLAEASGGQFAEARAHLERAVKASLALWPRERETLRSFASIGMSYEAMGDLERISGHSQAACEAYRKGLETWQEWPHVGVSSFYDREHAAQISGKMTTCRFGRP